MIVNLLGTAIGFFIIVSAFVAAPKLGDANAIILLIGIWIIYRGVNSLWRGNRGFK